MTRAAALLLAVWLAPGVALAQTWQVYAYPEPGFAVQFPAPPRVEVGSFRAPSGRTLRATRYVVQEQGIVYSVQVIDFAGTGVDASSVIADAEKAFGTSGKVTVALDARVNREYGRELSVNGADGSRSSIAIFFANRHLYELVGKALPPNAIARSGDAIRFQESLQFIGVNGGFRDFGR